MKIKKSTKYEYEKYNINEESGYTKWYDRTEITINRIIAVILSSVGFFVFLHICSGMIKQHFRVPEGGLEIVLDFCGVLMMLFIIPLLWKIIQLAIASKGKLGQKCILNLKNPSASVYNGKITRKRAIICLVVPCIVFALLFSILTILTDGVPKTFFLLMLYRTILCATDDIGTLWCVLRYVGKNDIIFGEYKKYDNNYL